MSGHDQCPSTTGKDPHKAKPKHSARTPHQLVGSNGRSYWRSADDLADTPEFRDRLEREFPSGASELLEGSRRSFMKIMGASLALAGAVTLPGCRRPAHNILPYSAKVPEDIIPGKPIYYATSIPLPGGGAEGVIVESHEGRPTKVEGNPLHSINRGKTSVWAQSSVLDMYDPDRLTDPVFTEESEEPSSWDTFIQWSKKHFAAYDAPRGEGVAILVDKKTSPTLDAMKARVLKRWPNAMWVPYDALQADEAVRGSAIAFGRPMREVFSLEKAKIIVSLDRDFLHQEAQSLPMARGFAAGRRAEAGEGMNRLYVVESDFTITGGKADHRMKLAPTLIPAFMVQLAKAVLAKTGIAATSALANAVNGITIPQGVTIDSKFIEAVASDLADEANRRRSVIIVGPTQPAGVHALAHAINDALGNSGSTVNYLAMSEDEAASSVQGITALTQAIDEGKVKTVVCLNVNPVYNAPVELNFAATFKKAPTRITLSHDWNETVEASNWRLNGTHYLEAWGDTEATDGTIAPIQPLIAPLYAGRSDIEVLAIVLGERVIDGYELVRATWRQRVQGDFEKVWRRALHDGVMAGTTLTAAQPEGVSDRVAPTVASMTLTTGPADGSMDVVFTVSSVHDGRFANNTWLQELPHPVSKIVWDNVAYVSPATARRLEIHQSKETDKKRGAVMATLTIGGVSTAIAAWALPGLPDNVAIVPLGYGRRVCGRVGINVGFDAYKVRGSASRRVATGAKLEKATTGDRWYHISSTQTHGSMEGRAIVREADLERWAKYGHNVKARTDNYGNSFKLNAAEQMGELSHLPANKSVYENPYNRSFDEPDPRNLDSKGKPPAYAVGPQWAMTIDLSTCIGCNVCTIACQSENNIPSVGKMEVSKYREMHWIRVDRYFTTAGNSDVNPEDADSIAFQPVACVHCENAPCEVVCPVNATVHGPEGLNYMTYNRCIGTRYCANNCPYKVRRFNFFDFGVAKFNGDHMLKDVLPGGGPKNVNLIPPRLRDKLDEISKMGMNPDVTVRSRGVMEKCSYCVQRINEARIEVKLKDMPGIPDGFFQTACQQACPTDAIIFGDKLDRTTSYDNGRVGSRVHASSTSDRAYALLGFLNTRPRTSHLISLRNPHKSLVSAAREDLWHHEFDDHGHGDHHDHNHDHDHGHEHDGHSHGLAPSRRSYLKKGAKLSLTVLDGVSGVLA